jgi:hypothetical protein
LQREAEVHRLDRVAHRPRAGQVEHVPARDHVDAPPVVELERHEVIGVLTDAGDIGRARDGVDVDFGREVAGIGHDDAVPQQRQVRGRQHVPAAGDRDDEIGVGDGLLTRRCAEAVQMRAQPGDRIDVHHGHPRAGAAEVGRDSAPARAIAEDRDLLAVGHAVGQPQVGLERALADGVLVLGELLDRAVVDHQDRPPQAVTQRFEAHPAGRRLLGSPAQAVVGGAEVGGEQVAAVVEDEVRPGRDHLPEVPAVHLPVPRRAADHRDALGVQRLQRLGLGRVQVAGRDQPRSAIAQGQEQRHGLGLQVDASPDGQPAERQRVLELRRDRPKQVTVLSNPVNARRCHAVAVSRMTRRLEALLQRRDQV